jgi:hypothetical protein
MEQSDIYAFIDFLIATVITVKHIIIIIWFFCFVVVVTLNSLKWIFFFHMEKTEGNLLNQIVSLIFSTKFHKINYLIGHQSYNRWTLCLPVCDLKKHFERNINTLNESG